MSNPNISNTFCNDPKTMQMEIKRKFERYFLDSGFKKVEGVPVSSGIDSSVRFIGSHTSVLKNYILLENYLPNQGVYISQDCLRTKNLKYYFNDEYMIERGSCYPVHGLLVPYTQLDKICSRISEFLIDRLNIPISDIKIRIHSSDNEIISAVNRSGIGHQIELNTISPDKYYHKFGINNIFGRVARIALFNVKAKHFIDFVSIILIYESGIPKFVEISISPYVVLMSKFNMAHSLELGDWPSLVQKTEHRNVFYKAIDAILVAVLLYNEGLKPSNRHNRNRILKTYVDFISYFSKKLNLTLQELITLIRSQEIWLCGDLKETKNIINDVL